MAGRQVGVFETASLFALLAADQNGFADREPIGPVAVVLKPLERRPPVADDTVTIALVSQG